MSSEPLRTRITALTGKALFWASVVGLPAASLIVVTVLAHALPSDALPKIAVVFSLSLIGSVLPMGVQARAAADSARSGGVGSLPRKPVVWATVALVAASVPVSIVVGVGVAAVVLPSLSLGPAMAVAAIRGDLIGRGEFGRTALNNLVEVSVRLVAGIVLGLAFGADGVGASLLLCSLAALALAPAPHERTGILRLPAALVATTALILSVQADLLVAPRVLGGDAVDYVSASLPSKGVYLALAAGAWLAVPNVLEHRQLGSLLRPVLVVTGAGVVLTMAMLPLTSLIGRALDRPAPSRTLLAVLGVAMACSVGSWVLLQVRLTRGADLLWVPSVTAIAVMILSSLPVVAPLGMAWAMLSGQAAALAVGLIALVTERRASPVDATEAETSWGDVGVAVVAEAPR